MAILREILLKMGYHHVRADGVLVLFFDIIWIWTERETKYSRYGMGETLFHC